MTRALAVLPHEDDRHPRIFEVADVMERRQAHEYLAAGALFAIGAGVLLIAARQLRRRSKGGTGTTRIVDEAARRLGFDIDRSAGRARLRPIK